jgi:hypothetical protein
VVFRQGAVTEGGAPRMEGYARGTDASNESIAEPLDRKGTVDVTRLLYGV